MDCGAIKVSTDGAQVLWATWLGGSSNENNAASIRVGPDGKVYVARSTSSADFPTTAGAYDGTHNGGTDYVVVCLTPDGSDLVYATFLGGSGDEALSTHNLAVDDQGNAYVALQTSSTNYPISRGILQRSHGGGGTDCAVTKLSPTGRMLASTYLGGSGTENADGIYVDPQGNVFVTGDTQSTNFPVTANALQSQNRGGGDAFVALLSADFSRLLYSTYLGGPANDNGRAGFLGRDGRLYVTGSSDGSGWPVRHEYQSTFQGGAGDWGSGDCVLAKLSPASTITVDPGKTYQTITGWEAVAFALEPTDPAFPNFKDTLIDQAVNDLGINRVRLEIRSGVENSGDNWSDYQAGTIDYQTWRSRRYATVNDNADPCSIDWSGFHFSEMDNTIERIVNPLRAALAAQGREADRERQLRRLHRSDHGRSLYPQRPGRVRGIRPGDLSAPAGEVWLGARPLGSPAGARQRLPVEWQAARARPSWQRPSGCRRPGSSRRSSRLPTRTWATPCGTSTR